MAPPATLRRPARAGLRLDPRAGRRGLGRGDDGRSRAAARHAHVRPPLAPRAPCDPRRALLARRLHEAHAVRSNRALGLARAVAACDGGTRFLVQEVGAATGGEGSLDELLWALEPRVAIVTAIRSDHHACARRSRGDRAREAESGHLPAGGRAGRPQRRRPTRPRDGLGRAVPRGARREGRGGRRPGRRDPTRRRRQARHQARPRPGRAHDRDAARRPPLGARRSRSRSRPRRARRRAGSCSSSARGRSAACRTGSTSSTCRAVAASWSTRRRGRSRPWERHSRLSVHCPAGTRSP